MDLQRLKERYPILVSYMENQHYSWQYIKHVKNEARWILRESENYGWKTYDDVYQTCVKKYSNKYTLLYKRKMIRVIELFVSDNILPDGLLHVHKASYYDNLCNEYKRFINVYRDVIKSKQNKPLHYYKSCECSACSFLFRLQKQGIYSLEDVTEEDVMNVLNNDKKLIGSYHFRAENMNTLQYVVGEAKAGQPAVIRFFGRVTEETTSRFNDEFDFLENIIRPSCIRVLINSEGGSVLYGMSTYSTIANATVDTECIIEGVAASMASIIWAAGKRSLMRDYAILMIHNPMLPDDDGGEPSDMVTAFTKQIETIYRKRFGLKAEHVRAIMDGQAGKDGTYFDAQAAVKAGIIPAEHVIHTSKQLCRKVHDEIEGLTDTAAIQELMSRVSAGNKPFKGIEPTLTETENDMANENKTQGFEYGAIAASLGMKDGEVKDVMARISELAAMEPKYREIQKSLSDAQTVIAGKDASIRNLQTDLAAATARLSAYEQKEKDEQASRIETLVENAIAEGKIDREAKTQWVEMAGSNFELAESTLASIPAREKISKEIADDPANIQATAEATKTAEQLMAEKVAEVVGADFKFRKL